MSKTLVAYFSASGTTASVAGKLAQAANADLHEITPAIPYTSADLNWMDKCSRSSIEMNDCGSRPALAETDLDVGRYNTVFLGFPIWWYIAPTIVNSFLESHDFSGKKIVLFATSGGSGFGHAVNYLRTSAEKSTTITEGKVFLSNVTEKDLKCWIKKI